VARKRRGRNPCSALLIVDAQSVKNTDTAKLKGYDAGKKVSGIKRHIAVDTQGLPHVVAATTAEVTDRKGALQALCRCKRALPAGRLQAYASGERHSGIMQPVAAGLAPVIRRELARHYAELPKSAAGEPVERADAAARVEDREYRLPRCKHCHGPKDGPRNPLYPDIAGQYADYLALQLELFRDGKRGGSEYANVMHRVARRLDSRQIREIAEHYASLEWGEEDEPEEVGPVAEGRVDRGEERRAD